ncbi:MAG: hypothetical protein CMF52_08400 [Legionellales bacterium]|nr:hypothetical protein [Legionellales bacterium]
MELTIEQTLQQAIAAHNAGDLKRAERVYREVLQKQPKHPDANHNLGLLAIASDQIEASLPLFETALHANPNIEQFWMSYIDALVRNQRLKDAMVAVEKAKKKGFSAEKLEALYSISTKIVDNNMPSQEQLNSLLESYQSGRFNEAEKLSTEVTQQFPRHQFAWKVLGAVFGATGRKSEALEANLAAVRLSPRDAEGQSNLGNSFAQLGRFEEAEATYKQAIALNPEYAEANYNLGIILQELGRLDEAEDSYKQAIALKSDYAEAHSNLGNTLKELGRLEEAEISYNQALILNSDLVEAHNNLGITLKDLGRLDEAEVCYNRAIALKPDYAQVHYNLGNTLRELARLDEAEAKYMQAIALKPDYAEAYSNLGVTFQELGRLDEAEASYMQAVALKPDHVEAYRHLGATFQELGRLDEAEANFSRAIELRPDFAETYDQLGVILQAKGKFNEAEVCYKTWSSLKSDKEPNTQSMGTMLFEQGSFEQALEAFEDYDDPMSKAQMLESLYALGRIDDIYSRLAAGADSDDTNLRIAAISAFLTGQEKKAIPHNFCNNPMDFLYFANIRSSKQEYRPFIESVIDELQYVKTKWGLRTTRHGFQSDVDIFKNPREKISALKEIILDEIDAYYSKFGNHCCSFIEKWPSKKTIKGWHVVLKKQGHQAPHIHPCGWLSGVLYLKVVPALEKNEGAIEFSLNGRNYYHKNSASLIFQPEVGDLVLFPSSLHHRTIPFTTDTDRIIVSFDLQPEPTGH